MALIRVREEGVIQAPPADVYRIIADYAEHHPKILPPELSDLRVEQGGVGAGTVVTFASKVAGQTRQFRSRIDEPDPGRVLTETDLDSSLVTTYRFAPEGSGCRLTIETVWESPSVKGIVERWMAPRMLRPIYREELVRLERYAQELLVRVR